MVKSFIAKRFAQEQLNQRLSQAEQHLRVMRPISWIFFVVLFAFVPLVVIFSGYSLNHLIIPIGVVMVLFGIEMALLFHRAHKELFPALNEERLMDVLRLILCPPGAIRAIDLLTTNIISTFDPMVIAQTRPRKQLTNFIEWYMRDLYFPLKPPALGTKAKGIVEWYSEEIKNGATEYLKKHDPDGLREIFAPPHRDQNSFSYCPRCHTQFNIVDGDCADCPGVALTAFVKAIP